MSQFLSSPASRSAAARRVPRATTLVRVLFASAALIAGGAALAQGFPGGGGGGGGFGGGGMPGGGMHGGHGPPSGDASHRAPPPGAKTPEPLELLLRSAHELRQSLILNATQTERWADLQDALRDALEKRKAAAVKPTDSPQVPNPPLLFVQDMASAENALAASLDKAAKSMQAAFDALDDKQKRVFLEKMTLALRPDEAP